MEQLILSNKYIVSELFFLSNLFFLLYAERNTSHDITSSYTSQTLRAFEVRWGNSVKFLDSGQKGIIWDRNSLFPITYVQ